MKILLKIICFIVVFIFVGTGVGYAFHILPTAEKEVNKANGSLVTEIPTMTPTPGIPVKLRIAKLNITVPVESVGMDKQGRMDVPKNVFDTAWYDLGVRPGQQGNAVIDGHYDIQTGAPSVFYRIKTLQPGDKIDVTDQQGKTYTFSVTDVTNYNTQTFPLQQIFGPSTHYNLNLITCGGVWNHNKRDYSQRTVVFASLIQ